MKAIIPVTNDATLQALVSLRAAVEPGDWLLVNSGGVSRPADPAAVQSRAELLAQTFPQSPVYAFTSGFANVEQLSASVKAPIRGIFYDYEPNYPNEPEFSFDPRATTQNLARATETARAHGLELVAYLTGQGLFNPNHTWDYSAFRAAADSLVVQTQSSLKHNRWAEALDRLTKQFGGASVPIQVTFAPGLPNAVDIPTAMAAYDEAARRGFPAMVLWWVPPGLDELRAMLGHRKV